MGKLSVAIFGAGAVALSALGACSPKVTSDPVATPSAAATPESVEVNNETATFVAKAALSDMYEIESSKLALTRSKSAEIKAFAQQMIDAHTATSAELGPLAMAASITPPGIFDGAFAGKMKDLQDTTVENFDDKYIDQQTEVHENTLSTLKDFAEGGAPATPIKDFAIKTIPAVQAHLEHVKTLDKSGADDKTKSPT